MTLSIVLSIADALKSLLLRSLPDALLQRLKKRRYLQTLRGFHLQMGQ